MCVIAACDGTIPEASRPELTSILTARAFGRREIRRYGRTADRANISESVAIGDPKTPHTHGQR